MKSGGQHLVVSMRAIMEMNPDFVIVKIDKSNAYNKLSRAVAVDRLIADPAMRPYANKQINRFCINAF